jgi:hypothetical protein
VDARATCEGEINYTDSNALGTCALHFCFSGETLAILLQQSNRNSRPEICIAMRADVRARIQRE